MTGVRVVGIALCVVAIALFAACEGDTGPTGATGPAGSSSVIGFAHINTLGDANSPLGACVWPDTTGVGPRTAPPCVFNFGGAGTDSVTVVRNGPGDYLVQFWGSFESFVNDIDADRHELTKLAAITQGDGSYVIAIDNPGGVAREDLISVVVTIWKSDDLTLADTNFSVLLLR